MQEALIRALSAWEVERPADPTGWLITVAWRAFLDMARSETARRDREVRVDVEPPAGAVPGADDTLRLYFLCAHPDLTPSSAVALTLRAVGGLTTRQIAQAYLVPEPTMAQRISRAKSVVSRAGVDRPGDVRTVMRVLYLVFNEGYSGDVDLAAEAIRLTRQLAALVDDPEVHGLLALMLLHHARRRSRTRPDGSIVPLAEQDRSQWDRSSSPRASSSCRRRWRATSSASTRRRRRSPRCTPTRRRVEETDWVQIVEWYDELRRFADTPIVRLNRAVGRRRGRRCAGRAGRAGRRRRARAAARRRRRPPPREERRPRAGGPALRQRRPQRAEPRRTGPPDAPGRPAQPAPPAPRAMSAPGRSWLVARAIRRRGRTAVVERRRLLDGLVGAGIAVLVLAVALAVTLVLVTRPASTDGPVAGPTDTGGPDVRRCVGSGARGPRGRRPVVHRARAGRRDHGDAGRRPPRRRHHR